MTRLWHLGLVGAALVLAAALAPPHTAAAQARATEPLAVALAGIAAVNAGDVAALVGLTTDATTIQILPSPPAVPEPGTRISGREAVRAFWEQQVAAGLQARLVGPPRVAGPRVAWTQRHTTTPLRGQGQAIQGDLEATVAGGRVVALVARNYAVVPLSQFEALPAGLPAGLPRTGAGSLPLALGLGGAALALGAGVLRRRRRF
jgi:LPXTG-motif cell wall-anchored protein